MMSFFYSNYYDSGNGDGGYHPNSHDSSGNFASYYYNEFDGETEFFDQVPDRYYTSYDYVPPQTTISYSASTFRHSDLIRIDPHACYSGTYDPNSTHFAVSYSTVEFSELDFEEYDPTPYGGGYDPSLTYGKPLPPSAETCYPHSTRAQDAPALGGTRDGIPELPIAIAQDEEARRPGAGSGIEPASGEDLDHRHSDHEESEQSHNGNSGYSPWGGYGGGFPRMAPRAPPGCGLDAWDICDGIHGYWPCLSRDNRRDYGAEKTADREYCRRDEDRWQATADYLFGSADPYADRRYDSQVSPGHYNVHAHERQSEGQLYSNQVQYEYYGDSNSG